MPGWCPRRKLGFSLEPAVSVGGLTQATGSGEDTQALISIPVDRTRIRRSRGKIAEMSTTLTILRRRPSQPPRTIRNPGVPGRALGRKASTVPKSPAGVSTTNPCVRISLAGSSDLASTRCPNPSRGITLRSARTKSPKDENWVNSLPHHGRRSSPLRVGLPQCHRRCSGHRARRLRARHRSLQA
jgi:hypothetical protein